MPRTFFAPAHPDCIHPRKPGVALDTIVVHAMDGTFNGSISWFQQGKDRPGRAVPTAAHYLVSRLGDVCQMVPDDKKCYHCGNWNSRSIGIEFDVRVSPWAARPGKAPPFPENEWPPAMLLAGARVVGVLCSKYGIPVDRQHVVGHNEVPGATHVDPGPGLDWPAFLAACIEAQP
jgi:N-acetyl-anhydromuramyl-L-alanine amidase AmpD